jgi:polyisoprenoid-binding protein YceI
MTTWQLDPSHSNLAFGVKHMMVSTVRGRFRTFEVDADIDEANLERSKATVRIDASSIDTGDPTRDADLRGANFFDVEHHPYITFVSKNVELRGNDVRVTGDLTIRGVTREVELRGEVSGLLTDPWGGTRLAVSLEGAIDRRDWGLDFNVPLGGAGVLVGNAVKLNVDVELKKAVEAPLAKTA